MKPVPAPRRPDSRLRARRARGQGRPMAALAILALSCMALICPLARADAASGVALPDNPLQGRRLFASRQCHECHLVGDDHPGIGPALGEGHFRGTFLELGAALWNHVPGMSVTFEVTGRPWPRLSVDETRELIVFLYFIDYLGRPGQAAAGREAFEAKGCSSCHAIAGAGAHVGPDLSELERFASPLYVAQQIWNHGPSMLESMRARGMRPPSFEVGDLADLSAFIRQQAESGPQETVLQAPGNPNRGATLFVEKGCSKCHGAAGRGGRAGPDLAAADLHRSAEAIAGIMWNHGLEMGDLMRQWGVGWPEFQDGELADLVAFLYFLPFVDEPGSAQRGAAVFQGGACVECHGDGDGGSAPALAGVEATSSSSALVAAMWNHAPTMKHAILRQGRPWPELSGADLRDLLAFFGTAPTRP